jgi:hypothetical protein
MTAPRSCGTPTNGSETASASVSDGRSGNAWPGVGGGERSAQGSCPRNCGIGCEGLGFPQLAGFDLLFAGAETPRPWM